MADNIVTPSGTFATKDVGGVHHVKQNLTDQTGADAMGAVVASPAANTLLGRVKAVADAITGALVTAVNAVATAVGLTSSADRFAVVTPGNTVLNPLPKALLVVGAGNVRIQGSDDVDVEFAVEAKTLLPVRPKRVLAASSNQAATIVALY